MPLAIRCVYGPNIGKFYAGFDSGAMRVKWSESREGLESHAGRDVAGITMAMIDQTCTVVVAEKLPGTEESDVIEFADFMARGSWQSPSDELKQIIQKTVREKTEDPIHDQPASIPADPSKGYMSVWEWLSRALVATQGSTSK